MTWSLQGVVLGVLILLYFAAAIWAYRRGMVSFRMHVRHPGSWLFSNRYRPRVLRWVLKEESSACCRQHALLLTTSN